MQTGSAGEALLALPAVHGTAPLFIYLLHLLIYNLATTCP